MARKLGIIGIIFLVIMSAPVLALAKDAPNGMDSTLQTLAQKSVAVTYSNRGWGSVYNLPQSQFSVDEEDFYDNSNDFGEVGLYVLGLQNWLHPQYDGLNVDTNSTSNLIETAKNALPWVWTPNSVNYGTHNQETLPNKGIATVTETVKGINATSSVCVDETIPYNAWGLPKDTIFKQPSSPLTSIVAAGQIFLYAEKYASGKDKETYMTIATHAGDALLGMIVTAPGTGFGIDQSALKDQYDNTIPLGMMPATLSVTPDSEDTFLCADGGTIKLNENRKTYMAQAAVFLNDLSIETGEQKYKQASDIITKGITSLLECDGTIKDYTRWEGSGAGTPTCKPAEGDPYYSYQPGVSTADTKGYLIDGGTVLYLLQKANPSIYAQDEHYREAVESYLILEEEDLGSGVSRNGAKAKYATYSLGTKDRSYAQVLLSNVFLRASCQATDSDLQSRLQSKAYDLINKADILIPSELDAKIANAVSPDVGNNLLASSLLADNWKIITQGCSECQDADGDGYIDGVCAKDTKKYDCNDNDASIHPNAAEVCDGIDNDCNGNVDDGFDLDGDGYSVCAEPIDCDDNNKDIHPDALENKDEQDNDCNLIVDDYGVTISLIDDQNNPQGGAKITLIDYGNACANSFTSLTESIPQITEQCTTLGTCTTDQNGMCIINVNKDGKFQALALFGDTGLASSPIEYSKGEKSPAIFQTNGIVFDGTGGGTTTPAGENPYLVWGLGIVGIIIIVLGGVFLYKTGKLKGVFSNMKMPSLPKMPTIKQNNNTGSPRENIPTHRADGITILSSPKMKTLKKIPQKHAGAKKSFLSKIIPSKPERKTLREEKPRNFPKEKKLWKD